MDEEHKDTLPFPIPFLPFLVLRASQKQVVHEPRMMMSHATAPMTSTPLSIVIQF